jgi:hypothetical protein
MTCRRSPSTAWRTPSPSQASLVASVLPGSVGEGLRSCGCTPQWPRRCHRHDRPGRRQRHLCCFARSTTHSACRSNVPELQLALLLFVPSWQGSTCAAPCPKAGKQLARFEAVLLMLRSRRGGQDRGAAQRVTARHVRFSVDQKWPLGWWACRCYTALLQCCSKVEQRWE